jgi:hypothetical protein
MMLGFESAANEFGRGAMKARNRRSRDSSFMV